MRDQHSIYFINTGLLCGVSVLYLFQDESTVIYLIIGCSGVLQTLLLVRSLPAHAEEDWQLNQWEAADEVDIKIGLWNLFKAFKSSLVLILIYVFYSSVMMHYEINHRFTLEESTLNFISIPLIYMFVNLLLDLMLRRFKNLNILTILLLFVQIIFATMDVMLRLYNVTDVFSFVIFAVNMVLFQKLVFVHISITLLRIFDITNLRVRNYVNCGLSSDDQHHPVLRQPPRVRILPVLPQQ